MTKGDQAHLMAWPSAGRGRFPFGLDSLDLDGRTLRRAWALIDVVLTSLPFGLAFPILQVTLQYPRVPVIHHPWDQPTLERHECLAANPVTHKIVLPPAKYRRPHRPKVLVVSLVERDAEPGTAGACEGLDRRGARLR